MRRTAVPLRLKRRSQFCIGSQASLAPSLPLAKSVERLSRIGLCFAAGRELRIPTKPAMHSNLKPATRSDLKPATVPI
jgi:hypothetical protein